MTDSALDPRIEKAVGLLADASEYMAIADALVDERETAILNAHALRRVANAQLADFLWSLHFGDTLHVERFLGVYLGIDVFDLRIALFEDGELDSDNLVSKHPTIVGFRMLPGQRHPEARARTEKVRFDDPRLLDWTRIVYADGC